MTTEEEVCEFLSRWTGRVAEQLGHDLAQDVIQSATLAYLEAARSRHIQHPFAYARKILCSETAAAVRSLQRSRRNLADPDPILAGMGSRDPGPEDLARANETREIARGVILQMPARQRSLLVRAFLAEEPPGDTKQALSMTETQYRLGKSRAKRAFLTEARRVLVRKPLPRAA